MQAFVNGPSAYGHKQPWGREVCFVPTLANQVAQFRKLTIVHRQCYSIRLDWTA